VATSTYGSDTRALSIAVYIPPEIAISALKAPGELPDAVVNNEYSVTLTASGDGTVTWTIESGDLPAGLTLSADGTISGTPTEEGLFSVVLKAENTYGNDTVALTMLVEPEPITDIEIAEPAADLGTWGAVIAMAVLLVVISVSMAMRPKK